jgi:hypothetical protein
MTIETMVREMILKGVTDNESIVETISNIFLPETNDEMEQYSEAIIYAKFGVLN